jgi:hypothetical protein
LAAKTIMAAAGGLLVALAATGIAGGLGLAVATGRDLPTLPASQPARSPSAR